MLRTRARDVSLRDLSLILDTPVPIFETELVSSAGCSQVDARSLRGAGYDADGGYSQYPSKRLKILAATCSVDADIIVRARVSEPLTAPENANADMTYAYGWTVRYIGVDSRERHENTVALPMTRGLSP